MTWEITFGTITTLTAIIGLGAIFWQIRSAAESLKEDRLRNKRQATLDFWTQTLEKRNDWRSVLPDDRDPEGIAAVIAAGPGEDTDINKTVASYLNYYEGLATGVLLGIYDIETLDLLAGPRIMKLHDNYKEWIVGRRKHFDENTLFVEFEILAGTIRHRRETNPVRV